MTVEEKFKEVLSSNVKDEDIRKGIYEYCMILKQDFYIKNYTSKFNYDLQKTRTILLVLIHNIQVVMLNIPGYEQSLIFERLASLEEYIKSMLYFTLCNNVAELNESTGIWILKEEI